MISIATLLVAFALVFTAGVFNSLPLSFSRESPPPAEWKIEDLAWMSGDWEIAGARSRTEEHWTQASAGTLIGMGRTVAGGKTVYFEYLRIEARPDGIYYVAHPKAQPGTDFKLVRLEGQSATFENLAHDFPKRIIYRKNADGSMTARAEGDGTEKEKPQEFLFKPMK